MMDYALLALLLTCSLFLGMLLCLEVGRRIGVRRMAKGAQETAAGAGTIEGAVFGLLGLLVAFTFSGASSRFDTRRTLIVEETNDIGTAYLRLDLLPTDARAVLQEKLRQYVDTRLAVYQKLPDMAAAKNELAKAIKLQGDIWSQAVAACQAAPTPQAALLLLPALNAMIDITTTRTMATQMHPPAIIYVMLFGLGLASALLAGYGMASAQAHSWPHMLCFAAAMAVTVYVILDLEYPRFGLIRVDAFDQALVDLRESMR
jgi:hypothetical protein